MANLTEPFHLRFAKLRQSLKPSVLLSRALELQLSLSRKRGLALKKFDFTKRTSNNYPEFECSLARGGCHGDNDCHYRPVWCACRGETYVRYVKEKQDTGVSKVKATLHIGSWGDMGWYGCEWSVWASYYACYNYDRHVRKVVWYLPSRDVASDRVPLHHSDHHKVNHQGLMKGDGGAEKL